MKKTIIPVFAFVISAASCFTASAWAQTLYSPDQYPTAQGKYLQAPGNPQQTSWAPVPTPAAAPSPVAAQYAPPSSMNVPQPAPPAAIVPLASPVSAAPQQPAVAATPVSYAPAPVPPPRAVTPTSYDNMMTYEYDPNMDPAHPPYKTPIAHDAPAGARNFGLGTLSGWQIGLQVSDFDDQGLDASGTTLERNVGPNFGVTGDFDHTFSNGWFAGGDVRLAYAALDDSNNSSNNPDDFTFELRALGGHDFIFDDAFWGLTDMGLSPYSGLGFRWLSSDVGSDSSVGDHYLYLPFGVTPRFKLTSLSRLDLNMEYDLLVTGWQTSTASTVQESGYGLRGSLMYERPSWSIGPFLEFWHAKDSDTPQVEQGDRSIELGLQGKYKF